MQSPAIIGLDDGEPVDVELDLGGHDLPDSNEGGLHRRLWNLLI
jgi:hypothetical protein